MESVELMTDLMPSTKASRYLARRVGYLCQHGHCQAISAHCISVPHGIATLLHGAGRLLTCTLQTAREYRGHSGRDLCLIKHSEHSLLEDSHVGAWPDCGV